MDLLDRLAEENIRKGVEAGEFDDLPGAGQPLNLDDDSMVPPELRAGYRMLKNAGYLPPELELKREVQSVEALLAASEPDSEAYSRAQRRLRWLQMQLAAGRGGSALLDDGEFRARLLRKLG